MDWHSVPLEQILDELDTDTDGLSTAEAENRLDEFGPNELQREEGVSPIRILISQFQDILIYLLFIAALISVAVGFLPGQEPEYVEAVLILGILVANGLFGFIQDYRAERAIQALRDLSTPDATVRRDGERRDIDSVSVVPGDVIVIEQGDAIPADARLIESTALETNESALTGESANVPKEPGTVDTETPVADRSNMVFMNTSAVAGRGRAVVIGTGMDTQVGSIAAQLAATEDRETPFQREVDRLGRRIGMGVLALIALVAVVQFVFTEATILSIALVAITLAVAAVPEGLPAVVTLTLALGSRKLLDRNALIRNLPVVESLGSVDVIVTDKTGTLTENTMTVTKCYFSGRTYEISGTGTEVTGDFSRDGDTVDPDELEPLLRAGQVCNNAEGDGETGEFTGDPTEVALLVSARKASLETTVERIAEVPFSSDRKRMTVIVDGESPTAYMKGAPAVVLDRCDRILEDGEAVEVTEEHRKRVKERTSEFASDALRVLGFAYREGVDPDAADEAIESNLVFLGLQGMIDPPRSEVPGAVAECRKAGIRVVMATGDNIDTARAIGREVGFDVGGAMDGAEFEAVTDDDVGEVVESTDVFARVSPSHKVRLLDALQANGHNVAMTGDGVNDAPALRSADVGISMGERGTDVAKQAADMVLLDDNFVTIRDAVAEGRGIFDNIRKFVNYLLSANAGEVLVVFLGVLVGSALFPTQFAAQEEALILTPVMLLWINLVTDGLPALAIGADPKADDVMEREPRESEEGVISTRMVVSILGIGGIMTLTGLLLFFYGLVATGGLIAAQTILFTFLVVVEVVRIQVIRRRYGHGITSNKWLIGAIGTTIVLQLAVLYSPFNRFFGVEPLDGAEWGLVLLGFVGFLVLNLLYVHTVENRFAE